VAAIQRDHQRGCFVLRMWSSRRSAVGNINTLAARLSVREYQNVLVLIERENTEIRATRRDLTRGWHNGTPASSCIYEQGPRSHLNINRR
jgi:hypothetical protein